MFDVNSWVSCAWFDFAYGLYLRFGSFCAALDLLYRCGKIFLI